MGILDRFKRRKKDRLDDPALPLDAPRQAVPRPALPYAPAVPTSAMSGSIKAEMDLVLSQMENLRMQYDAISSRLQNIERLVTEIRSFCK